MPIRPVRLTVLPPLVKAPGTCLRGQRELPGAGVGCHDIIMRTSLPETGPRWHAIGKRTVGTEGACFEFRYEKRICVHT